MHGQSPHSDSGPLGMELVTANGAQRRTYRRFHPTAATTHTQKTQHAWGGNSAQQRRGGRREGGGRAGPVGRCGPYHCSLCLSPQTNGRQRQRRAHVGPHDERQRGRQKKQHSSSRQQGMVADVRPPALCSFVSGVVLSVRRPIRTPSLPFLHHWPTSGCRLQPLWSVLSSCLRSASTTLVCRS
jgi:hypothetical protein